MTTELRNADIPVFITHRDRPQMLHRCVQSLLNRGFRDVTVIDNDSESRLETVEPWPAGVVRIVHSDNTFRHTTPWALELVPNDRYYIVMDCDIELDCPDDVGAHLAGLLALYPEVHKIGLGIRTDDLLDPPPSRYEYSYKMERAVADMPLHELHGVRDAPIDTHFAMYRPGATEWGGITGARTEAPYLCRHLPWYNEQFSDEERLYYERTGTEWARTHSAEELVPLRIAVPFSALTAQTVIALVGRDILYRPMENDTSYFEMLAELWHNGDTFTIVEQDIVPASDAIDVLRACPEDWCALPYPYRGNTAWGLGCTKFSHRLIARHPDLFDRVAEYADPLHRNGHWCRMDMWTYKVLALLRGEKRHDHTEPMCDHIGGELSSHGCA